MYQILKMLCRLFVLILSCLAISSCKKDHNTSLKPQIVSAAGNITASVNRFRILLGEPLNVVPGSTAGRREINWEGVPDEFMSASMPKNFFNATETDDPAGRKRGFSYASDGDFRINNAGFATIEPTLAAEISPFSGTKVFANISSDIWDTQFQVAGENKAAAVKGFGAVFVDVDLANTSFLEFFSGDNSLGKFFVPPHDQSANLSFLGVYFSDAVVTRVRIRHGNGMITPGQKDISSGGTTDVVAMDDFLYSEPVAK